MNKEAIRRPLLWLSMLKDSSTVSPDVKATYTVAHWLCESRKDSFWERFYSVLKWKLKTLTSIWVAEQCTRVGILCL